MVNKTTLGSEGLGDKRPRWSGPKEEAQKRLIVIVVDSPERAPDSMLALEGAAQGALQEACATLEDRALAGGSPNTDQVVVEAPSEAATDPLFLARLAMVDPRKARMPDRIVLRSFVQMMEWDRPSVDTPALGPKAAQSIIDRWAPFNKRDSFVVHMCNLYPTLLQVSVVARAEEYSILFHGFMDRNSLHHVAEDGMCIHNHDFNKTVELVWLNFYHFEYWLQVMIFF